jgi:hypothetical protein
MQDQPVRHRRGRVTARKKPVADQPICSDDDVRRIDPVWIPGPVPSRFWEDRQNRRNYLLWLGHRLGFRRMKDWYRLTRRDACCNHGGGLFKNYWPGFPFDALRECFPEHEWQEWFFSTVPDGFWNVAVNRRRYMHWLGHRLGFRRMKDWYRLTYQDLAENRAGAAASIFWHSSPVNAVKECFPGYDWQEWFFVQVPATFWRRSGNRRRYMAWLGQQLGFRRTEDWYRATTADFQRHRGGSLLLEYRSSVSATVMACFPRRDWKEWLFERAPSNLWEDRQTCRKYMKWLGQRLGYKTLDNWYRIKGSDFVVPVQQLLRVLFGFGVDRVIPLGADGVAGELKGVELGGADTLADGVRLLEVRGGYF